MLSTRPGRLYCCVDRLYWFAASSVGNSSLITCVWNITVWTTGRLRTDCLPCSMPLLQSSLADPVTAQQVCACASPSSQCRPRVLRCFLTHLARPAAVTLRTLHLPSEQHAADDRLLTCMGLGLPAVAIGAPRPITLAGPPVSATRSPLHTALTAHVHALHTLLTEAVEGAAAVWSGLVPMMWACASASPTSADSSLCGLLGRPYPGELPPGLAEHLRGPVDSSGPGVVTATGGVTVGEVGKALGSMLCAASALRRTIGLVAPWAASLGLAGGSSELCRVDSDQSTVHDAITVFLGTAVSAPSSPAATGLGLLQQQSVAPAAVDRALRQERINGLRTSPSSGRVRSTCCQ